ncbi:DUF6089 family protein [Hymenobacter psychrotolerans]|uniref:Outer membrane protein beta-barrel domain-containing protein n=1 Tax=Hymenobacter psychrotolerans DSM 18569 TaxID=1121959 RepID=A0A1M6P1X4_9BACT|nr:DUF6089 family protein [Hymenobacter psychrotolerans]SHK01931.1 Outer membrane protein beta-barrel domain-containing protein [Hymenobacter psychrotolerans DSM 18569]
MKQIVTYTLALVLALPLVATEASAQQFSKRKQYNSVGLTINAMNYFGDITPKPSVPSLRFGATRLNVGASFTHRFTPRISARAALAYGTITGDDSKAADPNDPDAKYRYNRNMSFRNNLAELSVVGIFDLIPNRNTYVKRPDLVPYVFGGIAGYTGNPQGNRNGSWVDLQPLKTEGVSYDKAGIAIPFGGGVRYKVNKSFDVGLEVGFRKTFNDYLDDVSTVYVDQSTLSSDAAKYFGGGNALSNTGEFANFNAPGSQRGKSDEDDWYVTTGITVNYILAPRVKSPKFR